MDDAKKQLVDKLQTANNILVTVSRDPSVDQLSALIGLTLLLTKEDKHAAAVFSGKIPSTIEFLKPEETIESNTDSLRDFIIALDKNKADKLRYKVEDNVVRIFITPYKTSITAEDFDFSQGDFNVDLVVALGVKQQEDLDEAIMAHGQILHDATVASINVDAEGGLGTINWHQPASSSLSELVTELGQAIDDKLFDEQISTALMTGIVAETDRFSNERTSSETMNASAKLMSSGANQQLVASKLQDAGALATLDLKQDRAADPSAPIPITEEPSQPVQSADGSLAIDHPSSPAEEEARAAVEQAEMPTFELPTPNVESLPSENTQPIPQETDSGTVLTPGAKIMTEPPTMAGSGDLTPYGQDGSTPQSEAFSMPQAEPPQLLERPEPPVPSAQPDPGPSPDPTPAPADDNGATTAPPLPGDPTLIAPDPTQPTDEVRTHETLAELEEAVASPHLKDDENLGTARDEVNKALNDLNATEATHPAQASGSQQLGPELHPSDLSSDPGLPPQAPTPTDAPATPTDPNAPPPVPPPIPFQFGNPPPQQ